MKVIICDDQAIVRDGLELLLKLEDGIDVIGVAQDGAEAVQLAARELPDLVLMDLHMPELDGFAATRLIRAAQLPLVQSLPIIAVTANAMDGDREKCLQAGMNEYISKPVDRIELLSMIERFTSA